MKNATCIILSLCILFFIGCDKQESEGENGSAIFKILESNENLSAFTQAIKDNNIEINESQLTILAIENSIYNQIKSLNIIQDEKGFLENHIIKGAFPESMLTYGMRLEAINGNSIAVKTENGDVYFSGIKLNTADTEVRDILVHKVSGLIKIEEIISEADFNDQLLGLYPQFNQYIEYWYLFDGVLTDEASAYSTVWNNIDNHTFTMNDAKIEKLWFDAYNLILDVNVLLEKAKSFYPPGQQQVFGELYAIRGILYFILNAHFGAGSTGVILYGDIDNFFSPIPRATSQVTMDYIANDLHVATSILSASNISGMSRTLVNAFLARTYTLSGDNQRVAQVCEEIINTGIYALELNSNGVFTNQSNNESIYLFQKSLQGDFNSFYQKGSFVSLSRYTDILLLYAKCKMELGDQQKSAETINQILLRNGEPTVQPPISPETIVSLWHQELNQEGWRYISLKMHDKLQEVLQMETYKQVLPLPLSILNINPYVIQNPGY